MLSVPSNDILKSLVVVTWGLSKWTKEKINNFYRLIVASAILSIHQVMLSSRLRIGNLSHYHMFVREGGYFNPLKHLIRICDPFLSEWDLVLLHYSERSENAWIDLVISMLVTVFAILVININYPLTLASGADIQKLSPRSKFCDQHPKIVANLKLSQIFMQNF